jgi:tetratricopeptide (TPR) repeat protein
MTRRQVISIGIITVVAVWAGAGIIVLTHHLSHKVAATVSASTLPKAAVADLTTIESQSNSLVLAKQYDQAATLWQSAIDNGATSDVKYNAAIQQAQVYVTAGDHAKAVTAYQQVEKLAGKSQFNDVYDVATQANDQLLELSAAKSTDATSEQKYAQLAQSSYQSALTLTTDAGMRTSINQQLAILAQIKL